MPSDLLVVERTSPGLARLPLGFAAAGVMREQLDKLLGCEAAVRAGDDPEAVHRMRVATRRLRTALRLFAPWAGDYLDRRRLESLGEALRELAEPLGRVRDEDVLAETLRRAAEEANQDGIADAAEQANRRGVADAAGAADRADLTEAPAGRSVLAAIEALLAARRDERAARRRALTAALDGEPFELLRGPFASSLDVVLARESGHGRGRATVRRAGPKLLAATLKRLRRSGRRVAAPTTAVLHRTRIRAKRLRYAGEFLAPAFGPTLATTVDAARDIQDALGALRDDDYAAEAIVAHLERGTSAADEAAALAGVLRRLRDERDDLLLAFGALVAGLPKPGALRGRLEEEAA